MPIFAGVAVLAVDVVGVGVVHHWRRSRRSPEPPDLAVLGATLRHGPGSRSGAVALDELDEL
jgi:hypothetical protein